MTTHMRRFFATIPYDQRRLVGIIYHILDEPSKKNRSQCECVFRPIAKWIQCTLEPKDRQHQYEDKKGERHRIKLLSRQGSLINGVAILFRHFIRLQLRPSAMVYFGAGA